MFQSDIWGMNSIDKNKVLGSVFIEELPGCGESWGRFGDTIKTPLHGRLTQLA